MTEGKPLNTAPFIDILPDSMQQDKTIQAAAEALDSELFVVNETIPPITLWPRIDSMTEPELSTLAGQFSLIDEPVWGQAEDDETKRKLLQGALELHRYKGTPWAIREVMQVLGYGEIELLEGIGNLHYDGVGEHDGVYTYGQENAWAIYDIIMGPRLSTAEERALRATLQLIAPARCHLDQFLSLYRASMRLNIQTEPFQSTATVSGKIMHNWSTPLTATWVTVMAQPTQGATLTWQVMADNTGDFALDIPLSVGQWSVWATASVKDPLGQMIPVMSDTTLCHIDGGQASAVIRVTQTNQALCYVDPREDTGQIWLSYDGESPHQNYTINAYGAVLPTQSMPLNTPITLTVRNSDTVVFSHSDNSKDPVKSVADLVTLLSVSGGRRNIDKLCYGQSTLTQIASGAFDDLTALMSADWVFRDCVSLSALPTGLFAHAPEIASYIQTFYGCSGLTSLPSDLFRYTPKVRNFTSTFSGCSGLTHLPSGLFSGLSLVTTFTQAFRYCSGLMSLPADMFQGCGSVTSFNYVFGGCRQLAALPARLFQDCPHVVNFSNAFNGCAELSQLPDPLFAHCTLVTNYQGVFNGCNQITQLSGDLFVGQHYVTTYASAFSGCSQLKAVPATLFADSPMVGSFQSVFANCGALTTLPGQLFQVHSQATTLQSAFSGCVGLSSVSGQLFDGASQVETLTGLFERCEGLSNLPPTLLHPLVSAKHCASLFSGCSQLAAIPTELLHAQRLATNFYGIFRGCSQLTSLPATLFQFNTLATSFNSAFSGCVGLLDLPGSLFQHNRKATQFESTFLGCSRLRRIPFTLFAENTLTSNLARIFAQCQALEYVESGLLKHLAQLNDLTEAFMGCTALTSTVEAVLGETVFARLGYCTDMFNGCIHLSGAALPFITRHESIVNWRDRQKGAFAQCRTLVDFNDLPESWK
ncbi:phage tail protein [Providencia huashanensis]|uniref:phage tail protein n=1 Tax=Providencia huashanensis TaxID=3037798 RepID=UPI002AFF6A65|nr:phage tail protein [Providencia sp. 23021821]